MGSDPSKSNQSKKSDNSNNNDPNDPTRNGEGTRSNQTINSSDNTSIDSVDSTGQPNIRTSIIEPVSEPSDVVVGTKKTEINSNVEDASQHSNSAVIKTTETNSNVEDASQPSNLNVAQKLKMSAVSFGAKTKRQQDPGTDQPSNGQQTIGTYSDDDTASISSRDLADIKPSKIKFSTFSGRKTVGSIGTLKSIESEFRQSESGSSGPDSDNIFFRLWRDFVNFLSRDSFRQEAKAISAGILGFVMTLLGIITLIFLGYLLTQIQVLIFEIVHNFYEDTQYIFELIGIGHGRAAFNYFD